LRVSEFTIEQHSIKPKPPSEKLPNNAYRCLNCRKGFSEARAHRTVTLFGIFVRCPRCGLIMKVTEFGGEPREER